MARVHIKVDTGMGGWVPDYLFSDRLPTEDFGRGIASARRVNRSGAGDERAAQKV